MSVEHTRVGEDKVWSWEKNRIGRYQLPEVKDTNGQNAFPLQFCLRQPLTKAHLNIGPMIHTFAILFKTSLFAHKKKPYKATICVFFSHLLRSSITR